LISILKYLIIIGQLLLIKLQKNNKEKLIKKLKVKPYIILLLNTSRKHVNYEEDKNKVSIPMNKPYNIQNTNICNGIFHISFFKALLINEVLNDSGRNDPDS
jgi:hypothetical protein